MPGEQQQAGGAQGGTQGGAAGAAGGGAGAGAAAGTAAGAAGSGGGGAAGAAAAGAAAAGAGGAQGAAGGTQAGAAEKAWWDAGGAGKPELKPPTLEGGGEWDKDLLGEIEKWATDGKIGNDPANGIFPILQKGLSIVQGQQKAAFEKTVKDWADAIPKQYGDKEQFAQAKQDAARFVEQFGDKELKEAFTKFGFGHHPAVFRIFAKANAFIRERLSEASSEVKGGRSASGNGRGATPTERANNFYSPRDGDAQGKQ
jgi:hypothetical protein